MSLTSYTSDHCRTWGCGAGQHICGQKTSEGSWRKEFETETYMDVFLRYLDTQNLSFHGPSSLYEDTLCSCL